MKLLFLDMDGVLNSEQFWKRRDAEVGSSEGAHDLLFRDNIDPEAVARLNRIVTMPDVLVVISSTWRKFFDADQMEELLYEKGFRGSVVGMTEDFDRRTDLLPEDYSGPYGRGFERGHEISHFVKEWMKDYALDSFVVLDDNDDMATVRTRFVQTSFETGLTDADVDRAIEILGQPIWKEDGRAA